MRRLANHLNQRWLLVDGGGAAWVGGAALEAAVPAVLATVVWHIVSGYSR